MKMSRWDNFRMHQRGATNWKEGGESYYNSQSLQWGSRKETHMLTINSQSCQQRLMCVTYWAGGERDISASQNAEGGKAHVVFWGRTPTA